MGVQSPTEIKASGGWQRCADEDVALLCDAHLADKYAEAYLNGADLPYPWELKDGVKSYSLEKRENDDSQGNYDGTLYVVMNKSTGSSAEMGVSPALFFLWIKSILS